MLNLLDIYKIL